MARGDILLVALPESDKREEKGNRPAVAVQTDIAASPMLIVVPVTSSLAALSVFICVHLRKASPLLRSASVDNYFFMYLTLLGKGYI